MFAQNGIIDSWQYEAALRLVIAVVLGGVVGLEREFHGRAAGFRTHALVCLASCLVMLVSLDIGRAYGHLASGPSVIRVDPARIAYGVMTGIGFIGAGVIIKTGAGVRGLTTAASLWGSAALGLATGVGLYLIAIFTAVLMLVVLMVLRAFELRLPAHVYRTVEFTTDSAGDLTRVRDALQSDEARVMGTRIVGHKKGGPLTIRFRLRYTGMRDTTAVYQLLRQFDSLDRVSVQ